jgi:hypothetical protein
MLEPLHGEASWRLPGWIAASKVNTMILHGDIPESLRHIGPVFDDAFAQGVKGTYEQVLEDLKAEDGLGIDLIEELYSFFGARAYLVWGDREGRTFQPFMIAFDTTDIEKVSKTVDALIRDDPEARPIQLKDTSGTIWHVAGEDGGEDFILGVVQGFAIYSNDLRLIRQMMTAEDAKKADDGDPSTWDVSPLFQNGSQHPFLLTLQGPRGADTGTSGTGTAGSPSSALDLIFQAPGQIWPTDREWNDLESVMRNLMPLEERSRVIAGFVEPHGWRFSMYERLPNPRKE